MDATRMEVIDESAVNECSKLLEEENDHRAEAQRQYGSSELANGPPCAGRGEVRERVLEQRVDDRYKDAKRIKHMLDEPVLVSLLRSTCYYIAGTIASLPILCVMFLLLLVMFPVRCVISAGKRIYDSQCAPPNHSFPPALYRGVPLLRRRVHCSPLWPMLSEEDGRSVAHAIVTVQGYLAVEDARQLLLNRIVHARDPRSQNLLYPRFIQLRSNRWYGHAWTEDSDFEVQKHVSVLKGFPTDNRPINSLEQLEDCLNELAEIPLKTDRPLWEALTLPDFGDTRCTLIVVRIHSSILDTICLPKLLCLLNDAQLSFIYEPRLDPSVYQTLWGISQVATLGAIDVPRSMSRPYVEPMWAHIRQHNVRNGLIPTSDSSKTVLTWARVPNVEQLMRAEKLLHCSIEELFLSFITGSFQRHLKTCGIRHPPDLHAAIPISLHRLGAASGDEHCKHALLPVRLPVSTEGSIPRLWEVQRSLEEALDGPLPYGIPLVSYAAEHLLVPPSLAPEWTKSLLARGHRSSSCVVKFLRGSLPSNASGAGSTDFAIGGHRVHSTLFYNPVPDHVVASFTFVLLGREILLSLSTERSVFPSADALLVSFQDQIQKLIKQVASRMISPIAAQLIAAAKPILIAASSVQEEEVPEPPSHPKTTDRLLTPSTEDVSLESLEELLARVKEELDEFKLDPDRIPREEFCARLSDYETQMQSLQKKITEKLEKKKARRSTHASVRGASMLGAFMGLGGTQNVARRHSDYSDLGSSKVPSFLPLPVSAKYRQSRRSRRMSTPLHMTSIGEALSGSKVSC